MATIAGKLIDGLGSTSPVASASITFIATTNSNVLAGQIIEDVQFTTVTDVNGNYSVDVENGSYRIEVTVGSIPVVLGTAIIDSSTPSPSNLLELLAASGVTVSDAQNILNQAIAAKNLAQQWAENPEDVEVEPGSYSALHHAAKSAASATQSAASALLASQTLSNLNSVNFNIARAVRKEIYGRSGFIEFDEGSNSTAGDYRIGFVNEGLVTRNGAAYETWMSDKIGFRNGSINIDGVVLYGVFGSDGDYYSTSEANIHLPPAPIVTNIDSTNNGLIKNGDFSLGNNGDWLTSSIDLTATFTGTSVQLSQTTADNYIYQSLVTEVGETYILEFNTVVTAVDDGWSGVLVGNGPNSPGLVDTRLNTGGSGLHKEKLEFVATAAITYITYHLGSVTTTAELFRFSVIDKSWVEQSNFVFIEKWVEDTSEKGFLYPLGNVQYTDGDTDGLTGITNGSFSGFQTYSLFGSWQLPSAIIGKGYSLSSMTAIQIANFVVNPRNNCYYTSDGKLVQVRFRVRTEPVWDEYSPYTNLGGTCDSNYQSFLYPQGKQVNFNYVDLSDCNTAYQWYLTPFPHDESFKYISDNDQYVGVLQPRAGGIYLDTLSYGNALNNYYALPIALIKRINKGAYHPVYNPRGTGKLLTLASGAKSWYEYDNSYGVIDSTIDCFGRTETGVYGNILTGLSGTPDSKLFDAIYASQCLDYRLSAKSNWSAANSVQHMVNGLARGEEGDTHYLEKGSVTPVTIASDSKYGGVATYLLESGDFSKLISYGSLTYLDDSFSMFVIGDSGTYYSCSQRSTSISNQIVRLHPRYGDVTSDFTLSTEYKYYIAKPENGSNSSEMIHCDIIGDPVLYPKITIDYTTTGVSQIVNIVKGNKVSYAVASGSTGLGTVGNYYVAKTNQSSIDLDAEDFTNTTNWIDTGSSNNVGWQEAIDIGYSLVGAPLLIGENDENYIPDGIATTIKLSKKMKAQPVLILSSTDAGLTWVDQTATYAASFNLTTNSITNAAFDAVGNLWMVFYKTSTNIVDSVANASIADGDIDDVITISNLQSSSLIQSLIKKVPVGSESTRFGILSKHQDINANLIDVSYGQIDLVASDVAVSLCGYKTNNGIEISAKELKHSGVNWGDDSKITQTDYLMVDTDLNGATVLTMTKSNKLKSDLR